MNPHIYDGGPAFPVNTQLGDGGVIAGKPWAMCGNGMQDDARARYAALR